MRSAPAGYGELLAGAALHPVTRVSSWRADRQLAGDVPVVAGSFGASAGSAVPDTVRLTVPATVDGRSWSPHGDPTHPLNTFGQQLRVQAGYRRPGSTGSPLLVDLGRFRIDDYEDDGSTVSVTASGLLSLLAPPSKMLGPFPAGGRTAERTMRLLASGRLPFAAPLGLPARTLPAGTSLTGDRLSACYEVCDTWPARLDVTADGVLRARPPFDPAAAADLRWTEGVRGTTRVTGRAGSRADVVNVWRVYGEEDSTTGRAAVSVTVSDDDPRSPTYTGVYGEAVEEVRSALITSQSQATAIGAAKLAGSRSNVAPMVIEAVPDHRVELDSIVEYVDLAGTSSRLRITGYTLPLGAPGIARYVGAPL